MAQVSGVEHAQIIGDYYKRSFKSTLDKDDFLQLLVTEMQNQDPTQPIEDREFIAQMAQFSALEQMYNLNTQLVLLRESPEQLTDLIGKKVTWRETDQRELSGIVDAVLIKEGEGVTCVEVNGEPIALSDITRIEDVDQSETDR